MRPFWQNLKSDGFPAFPLLEGTLLEAVSYCMLQHSSRLMREKSKLVDAGDLGG